MKISKRLKQQIFIILFILSSSSIIYSQTTYYVKTTGNDALTGTSWGTAYKTLQQALSVATSNDEIWVAAGTYYPDEGAGNTDNDVSARFNIVEEVDIYGGFDGVDNNFANRDWETNITILSGDLMQNDGANFTNYSDNATTVVRPSSSNLVNAILDGFTIKAGNGIGMVIRDGASMIVNNCTFDLNLGDFGGGISIPQSSSSATFNNCTFSNNKVTIIGGGASLSNGASASFNECFFLGNEALQAGGLGVNESFATVTNCVFIGNKTTQIGGAVQVQNAGGVAGGSTGEFINCTFSGNNESDGALTTRDNLSVSTIKNCIFWGNGNAEITTKDGGINNVTYSIVEGGFTGTGNLDADPLFVSEPDFNQAPTTIGNVDLANCSPAIDGGTNTGAPTDDINGNSRPIDGTDSGTATTDMGAYEYQSTYIQAVNITSHPSNQSKSNGQNVSFNVSATGSGLTYQWQKDNVDIMSANGSTYTINNIQGDEWGDYTCIVSNDCNSTTSNAATLTLTPSISVATQNAASTENIMTALTYQFTRTSDPAATLTVNFEISGTANKDDFTVTSPGGGTVVYDADTKEGTITFPTTVDTVTLEIVPTGDTLTEGNETIIVSITP